MEQSPRPRRMPTCPALHASSSPGRQQVFFLADGGKAVALQDSNPARGVPEQKSVGYRAAVSSSTALSDAGEISLRLMCQTADFGTA